MEFLSHRRSFFRLLNLQKPKNTGYRSLFEDHQKPVMAGQNTQDKAEIVPQILQGILALPRELKDMITTLWTPSGFFALRLNSPRIRDSSLPLHNPHNAQPSNAEFMRCNVRFEHEREELGRPNPLLACSACFALHPVRRMLLLTPPVYSKIKAGGAKGFVPFTSSSKSL